jgi:hypothetical protein
MIKLLMSYTLSKLYVDIKFDMFNMKFKNHLFCQIKVPYIDWLIIHIVIFELLKSFCHFFVNFQQLLHSHLFVQFVLARVWRTRAACFRETCILRQNVFFRFKCPIWTNNFFPSTKQWRDTYCFSRLHIKQALCS